ncbi:uncharacterized protein LY89DRAFT_782001 [Mollisia scopiformis]|uniref:Uncharacterized protein n=1 Tax=Mollisia scopiformis TaxID=149040 RepID=A0A194XAC2_MOLSC|nr:uncharacterized protein LY89DRAFT_782001 [Mollisia scopiformis]KUJ16712.1 hypothetical protein LY89DRAFT_782001 [Mollisia scopiformis]
MVFIARAGKPVFTTTFATNPWVFTTLQSTKVVDSCGPKKRKFSEANGSDSPSPPLRAMYTTEASPFDATEVVRTLKALSEEGIPVDGIYLAYSSAKPEDVNLLWEKLEAENLALFATFTVRVQYLPISGEFTIHRNNPVTHPRTVGAHLSMIGKKLRPFRSGPYAIFVDHICGAGSSDIELKFDLDKINWESMGSFAASSWGNGQKGIKGRFCSDSQWVFNVQGHGSRHLFASFPKLKTDHASKVWRITLFSAPKAASDASFSSRWMRVDLYSGLRESLPRISPLNSLSGVSIKLTRIAGYRKKSYHQLVAYQIPLNEFSSLRICKHYVKDPEARKNIPALTVIMQDVHNLFEQVFRVASDVHKPATSRLKGKGCHASMLCLEQGKGLRESKKHSDSEQNGTETRKGRSKNKKAKKET